MSSDKTTGGGKDSFNTLFSETDTGKHVPREVFVDLEPTVTDEAGTGTYCQFFHSKKLIKARKMLTITIFAVTMFGKKIIDLVLDWIQKLVDQCKVFRVSCSSTALVGELVLGLPSCHWNISLPIMARSPCWNSPFTQLPGFHSYSSTLQLHPYQPHHPGALCIFTVNNEATYDICHRNPDTEQPIYTSLNCLISQQIVSSIISSLRSDGALNVDLTELQTSDSTLSLHPLPSDHLCFCHLWWEH